MKTNLEKKSIMVIGAGPNQLNLIRSAGEAGFRTIAIDPNEQAPGREEADLFYCLAPDDFEGHCAVIEKHGITGIATTQMEKPIQFMAQIAEKFGFAFISRASADWARNKFKMKQRFQAEGVPCAHGILLHTKEEVPTADLASLPFPLIMKPVDAYSSRGVYTISGKDELWENFPTTAAFSSDGSVLVEEYIPGKMISVEGFAYQGAATIVQYTERYKFTPEPLRVELAHIQPALLSETEKENVNKVVHAAVKALRLDCCGFHAELKINDQGVFMIEIGARLGGDFNASLLVPLSTGINLEKIIATIAMGEPPILPPRQDRFSMIKWVELKEGERIKSLPDIDELATGVSGLAKAAFLLQPGNTVPRVTDSSKRAGYLVLTGDSREEVIDNALALEKAIQDQVVYYVLSELPTN